MKTTNVIYMLLLVTTVATGATKIGGVLEGDTRFKLSEGPYIITSDLIIPKYRRLSISAGCTIFIRPDEAGDTLSNQYDHLDKQYVSIRVFGTLSCIGRRDHPVIIQVDTAMEHRTTWYGIIIDKYADPSTEIAFTTIRTAYCGLTINHSAPLIRNTIFEYNHFGIISTNKSKATITNCVIVYNRISGVRTDNSNISFRNNIVAFNRNNGMWCDGQSRLDISYNCFSHNGDGNFIDCDPECGVLVKKNSNGDSIDIFKNIFIDPVFSGSVAELRAKEKDVSLPTNTNKVKNKLIASIIQKSKQKKSIKESAPDLRYWLSPYSPCINTGDRAGRFKDPDGSRNDMGIHGGPDHLAK